MAFEKKSKKKIMQAKVLLVQSVNKVIEFTEVNCTRSLYVRNTKRSELP